MHSVRYGEISFRYKQNMSETLSGYVEHVIFRNEDNGYTVFETIVNKAQVTCTGNIQAISEGEYFEAAGSYVVHPSYGEQFRIDSYRSVIPSDLHALERYLASGAIKGIGAALSARIIKRFGDDTLRIIEEEPERLAEIKGISERMAQSIAAQIVERSAMQDAFVYMAGLGISLNLSTKIYNRYQDAVYDILRENPYRIADEVNGVGFAMADRIAAMTNVRKESPYRVRSGIMYVLRQAYYSGSVYLPKDVLSEKACALLDLEQSYIEHYLDELSMEKRIVRKNSGDAEMIFSHEGYYLELDTARLLYDLNISFPGEYEKAKKVLEKKAFGDLTLEAMQVEAAARAAGSGIMILTGGPGTGKTTTLRSMIRYFSSQGMTLLLAAPTGRAAKRMEEATGIPASTIHRMLEFSGDPEDEESILKFQKNADDPLDADVVIIDEMSMVDIFLMHALLCAVTAGTRLVLVGDTDQLPSVGPGSVLKDMIKSGCFQTVCLNKIFRQAAKSDIIVNAHKINRGEHFPLENRPGSDFFFIERDDYLVTQRVILSLVSERLPKMLGCEPADVQVLTPRRAGMLGVESLNKMLQKYLNPASPDRAEVVSGKYVFREGDKVMQIKNNYQTVWETRGMFGIAVSKGEGVFNGDMGIIVSINDFTKVVTVLFDDEKYVEYEPASLEELELAYAVTVHKSQGSEYTAAVIAVFPGPPVLCTRNLLYTALTRAKKCAVITGEKSAFENMIDNDREEFRYTALKERIIELFCS